MIFICLDGFIFCQMADMPEQQEVLTLPSHLIAHLIYPGVRVDRTLIAVFSIEVERRAQRFDDP
jgi:hypothetical protein